MSSGSDFCPSNEEAEAGDQLAGGPPKRQGLLELTAEVPGRRAE